MKSFLVVTLLVGLLGLAVGEEGYSNLLKRLLAALDEHKRGTGRFADRHADRQIEKGAGVDLARRNSYGVVWKGDDKRMLSIYLQKSTDCADPCRFEITFQNDEGKTIGNELEAVFSKEQGGRVDFTESEIMDDPTVGKDKAGGDENAIGDGPRAGRLPDDLRVRVCRIEGRNKKACNTRPVDTTKDHDAVFFKTTKDDFAQ